MKLTYDKTCLGSKLHDELLNAGITLEVGISPVQTGEGITYIYVPDDTPQLIIDQVESIVINHDPIPLPPQPTQDDYLLDLDYRLCKIELGI